MTASLMVLAAVAVAVALIYTRRVMVPFVLAIFVMYLVSPIVDFLRVRLRVPKAISILVALLVVAGLLTLLGLLITTSVRGFGCQRTDLSGKVRQSRPGLLVRPRPVRRRSEPRPGVDGDQGATGLGHGSANGRRRSGLGIDWNSGPHLRDLLASWETAE